MNMTVVTHTVPSRSCKNDDLGRGTVAMTLTDVLGGSSGRTSSTRQLSKRNVAGCLRNYLMCTKLLHTARRR